MGFVLICAVTACTETPPPVTTEAQQELPRLAAQEQESVAVSPPVQPRSRQLDHSGRKQTGGASYYAPHFTNRKMANGDRFDPNSNIVASKTLPLGTKARVTNSINGKSTEVTVGDRGPFVNGRVVDVTPKVADELDLKQKGVAPVVVTPITVPQPDGGVKLGAGAAEANPPENEKAAAR